MIPIEAKAGEATLSGRARKALEKKPLPLFRHAQMNVVMNRMLGFSGTRISGFANRTVRGAASLALYSITCKLSA